MYNIVVSYIIKTSVFSKTETLVLSRKINARTKQLQDKYVLRFGSITKNTFQVMCRKKLSNILIEYYV